MKIETIDNYKLTDNILEHIELKDVLIYHISSDNAQGQANQIEAIVKVKKNINSFVGIFDGNHNLSREKVLKVFNHMELDNLENTGWHFLNMGLGHGLYVRDLFYDEFKSKYEDLINEFPFYLYSTWKMFSKYVLNMYFNNVKDIYLLKDINKIIEDITRDYS